MPVVQQAQDCLEKLQEAMKESTISDFNKSGVSPIAFEDNAANDKAISDLNSKNSELRQNLSNMEKQCQMLQERLFQYEEANKKLQQQVVTEQLKREELQHLIVALESKINEREKIQIEKKTMQHTAIQKLELDIQEKNA